MKPESSTDFFDREHKVISLFIENAKTYTQLSTGALFLSLTFLREVLGAPKDRALELDAPMLMAWLSLLAAIVFGALYQYYACKFLEWKAGLQVLPHRHHRGWPIYLIEHPWPTYLLMLLSFYLGAGFFTFSAIHRMTWK